MMRTVELDDTLATLLSVLVRRGMSLMRRGDAYQVDGPSLRLRRTLVAARDVDVAQAQGWIASDGLRWRITEAGALALRRGRGPNPAPVSHHTESKRGQRASTPAAPGELHPLQRLRSLRDAQGQPLVSGAQVEAGLRLAADFTTGGMRPRVTLDWSFAELGTAPPRGDPSRALDLTDRAEAARARVRAALGAVGPEFADLLVDVCCFETGLEAVESRRRWPARSARVVLGLGLDRLVRHYGTISQVPDRRSTIAVWRGPETAAG